MIYKFKSKAAGDVIMLGPNGDQLLRLVGREPASQGIFEPAAMPALLAALQAAVAADEAADKQPPGQPTKPSSSGDRRSDSGSNRGVSLRQRVWPMIEMLGRAHAAGQPVVWGV